MAKIKLITRGKTVPSPLYVRFTKGRELDLFVKTGLHVNPNHWDNSSGIYKNVKGIINRDEWNFKFGKIKLDILERYNASFFTGELIDRDWLKKTIAEVLNRPKNENKSKVRLEFVYYTDFAEWWLKNKAPEWKTGKNKYLDIRAIRQYNSFLEIWKKFEGRKKYRMHEVTAMVISKFIDFAQDDEGYGSTTIKRWTGRLRFFILRAQTFEIKTAPDFQDRVYVGKDDDVLKPYLNVEEINSIFNLDLSHDETLDNIRDSFIIALWSGLRISDFNRNLDVSNIEGDFINIKTKKTGKWVSIPLHAHVKQVLKKRMGLLPTKFSDKHVNENIKVICMLAGIDNVIRGKKFDSEKKRSVIGDFKKYELISSHCGRRSWATNHHGMVPNHILMDVGGWSSEKVFLHYIKRTKKESAEQLKKYYDEQYG